MWILPEYGLNALQPHVISLIIVITPTDIIINANISLQTLHLSQGLPLRCIFVQLKKHIYDYLWIYCWFIILNNIKQTVTLEDQS